MWSSTTPRGRLERRAGAARRGRGDARRPAAARTAAWSRGSAQLRPSRGARLSYVAFTATTTSWSTGCGCAPWREAASSPTPRRSGSAGWCCRSIFAPAAQGPARVLPRRVRASAGMRAESRAMRRRSKGIAALLVPRVEHGRCHGSRRRQRVAVVASGQFGVGANMAFRTAALREAGASTCWLGAGTPACGGEDIELFVRVVWRGARVGYEPAAIVLHEHRGDEDALRTQMRQYGIGFTAALTALVAGDPRHAATMLATILELGLRRGTADSRKAARGGLRRHPRLARRRRPVRGPRAPQNSPGMLSGVDAFLRSWMHARRA